MRMIPARIGLENKKKGDRITVGKVIIMTTNYENRYAALWQKHGKEFITLPIKFVDDEKGFQEIMEDWGLDPEKDIDKITSVGSGGFVLNKDVKLVLQMLMRHAEERDAAIAADTTGEGFIYDMFIYELNNRGFTEDFWFVMSALGYTVERILNDPRLKLGFFKATKDLYGRVPWELD